jgi:hypothetical protein
MHKTVPILQFIASSPPVVPTGTKNNQALPPRVQVQLLRAVVQMLINQLFKVNDFR